jgi:hypothetical protein
MYDVCGRCMRVLDWNGLAKSGWHKKGMEIEVEMYNK